jgi:hypothetical protein
MPVRAAAGSARIDERRNRPAIESTQPKRRIQCLAVEVAAVARGIKIGLHARLCIADETTA